MRFFLTLICILTLFTRTWAQPKTLTYSHVDPNAKANVKTVYNKNLPYNYLVYFPEGYEQSNKKYPMILSLHGRSLTGTNLEKVKSYGVIYEAIRGKKLDFVVVSPQTPGNGWDSKKLIQLLDHVQSQYRVDTCRTYVTGMSMGGYGAWHVAGDYPHRFAAVAPICGGGNPKHAENLCNFPTWVFHGARDRAVPITESSKMVNAIKAKKGDKNLKFTIYQQYGHSELAHVFNLNELYDWFLQFEIP